jgi:hypothetical protein
MLTIDTRPQLGRLRVLTMNLWQPHVTPLASLADGDRLLIFAANGGRLGQPAWYHHLVAPPDVTVEGGDRARCCQSSRPHR